MESTLLNKVILQIRAVCTELNTIREEILAEQPIHQFRRNLAEFILAVEDKFKF